jgi:hypothetical protein
VAGPLRRRIVAVLALAVGFGVVSGTTSAQAAPVAKHATVHIVHTSDWWW